MVSSTRLAKVISLCKTRGFIFQTAEAYGGLRGCFDYGPLGVELKRNLTDIWWHDNVFSRPDVHGMDASIFLPRDLLTASGHIGCFKDMYSHCLLTKRLFKLNGDLPSALCDSNGGRLTIRAPDASTSTSWAHSISKELAPGARVEVKDKALDIFVEQVSDGKLTLEGATSSVNWWGAVEPLSGSPFLETPKEYNLMLKTHLTPQDPTSATELIDTVLAHVNSESRDELRERVISLMSRPEGYLRPETAQSAFTQFSNIVNTTGAKAPFGIAQIGSAFRNEMQTDHFLFRCLQFEQMELQFFVTPERTDIDHWFSYWRNTRLAWWRGFANNPASFTLRDAAANDLAHYSEACTDIEYDFPWGTAEIEGIAHRGDYDIRKHASRLGGANITDDRRVDPATGSTPWTYVPHVIEPSAGVGRGVLALLCDAYDEEPPLSKDGRNRLVLRLHPRLAPVKVAVLPVVEKVDEFCTIALGIRDELLAAGISAQCDVRQAVGRRYRRHDEIGTPYCVTIDNETLLNDTVTLRYRDCMGQERVTAGDLIHHISKILKEGKSRIAQK